MFSVSLVFNHVAFSISQGNIIVWVSHFHMVCTEVAICCKYTCIFPPSIYMVISAKCILTLIRRETDRSGSSVQSSGKLMPGCGHVAQKRASSPFPGDLSVS